MAWICPNGCESDMCVVCGGDTPWFLHGITEPDQDNIYFLMDCETEEYTREVCSDVPFMLTDEDWECMYNHANGGCAKEPQCQICHEMMMEDL